MYIPKHKIKEHIITVKRFLLLPVLGTDITILSTVSIFILLFSSCSLLKILTSIISAFLLI